MNQDALPFDAPDDAPAFDGDTYDEALDHERLGAQSLRVWTVISDGKWRTLDELSALCGDPPASISARLRDFRKKKFGSHTLLRRRRGDGARGWFEYALVVETVADAAATHKEAARSRNAGTTPTVR